MLRQEDLSACHYVVLEWSMASARPGSYVHLAYQGLIMLELASHTEL